MERQRGMYGPLAKENPLSIFARFRRKSSPSKGLVEINVSLTVEEVEATEQALDRFAAVATSNAPEGSRMFVPPKVQNAISAQGLADYAQSCVRNIEKCGSGAERTEKIDRAIKAQMNAYAHHNLPEYIFQIAAIYDLVGDTGKHEEFTRLFQQVQEEFKPDQIDSIFSDKAESLRELRDEMHSDAPPAVREGLDQITAMELYQSGFMKFS